jgi:hypothetical protein
LPRPGALPALLAEFKRARVGVVTFPATHPKMGQTRLAHTGTDRICRATLRADQRPRRLSRFHFSIHSVTRPIKDVYFGCLATRPRGEPAGQLRNNAPRSLPPAADPPRGQSFPYRFKTKAEP